MSTPAQPRASVQGSRRDTKQRRVMREHLSDSEAFLSAQQLHDQIRDRGDKVGLATVYRTLNDMAEVGEVDAIRYSEGETLYRQCGTRHHHHLTCRNCGLTVELAGPAVERWASQSAEEHEFSDVEHVVELFGLCRECAAGARA